MNGADVIIQTAANAGIEICFANPGTTELPLVAALDEAKGIRPVLGLFEGCCTGAADGYGRMARKPALTLLHLGPGLANGLANLHNARRANTPVVNLIGEHAAWHRPADAPLTMDIEALAGTVSGWQRTVGQAGTVSADMADAVAAAASGRVATLIVPHDCQLAPCSTDALERPLGPANVESPLPDAPRLETLGEQLGRGGSTLMLLGGGGLSENGLRAAARIRDVTGCDLMVETFPARMERGGDLPHIPRLPYFPTTAVKVLAPYDVVILAGAREPVAFFGYPGQASHLLADRQHKVALSTADEDTEALLVAQADLVAGKDRGEPLSKMVRVSQRDFSRRPISARAACEMVAALQPQDAIVVDESVSSGGAYFEAAAHAPRHTLLTLTGGAIGMGMPCSVGAAMACPDRPVIDLQADGSALYTPQSLWMQARYHLDITTIIFANHSYDILKMEIKRAGRQTIDGASRELTGLGQPAVDWVALSRSMGVPAVTIHDTGGLSVQLQKALAASGPHLIVVALQAG